MSRFNRKFKLWEYWVTHSQLLLRSPGDLREPADSQGRLNIDIEFVDVDYVELPTLMWEMEILKPSPEDCQKASAAVSREVSAEHIFVIVSQGRRYMIVAGAMQISQNDLELMKTNFDRPPYRRSVSVE